MTYGGPADGDAVEFGWGPPPEQSAAQSTEPARQGPPEATMPVGVAAVEGLESPDPGEPVAEPSIEPVPTRPRSRRARSIAAIVVVLAVATGVLGYLSVHNDSVSNRYRHLDAAEIALVHRLDAQVASANVEIKNLNAQLAATQGHLATVANQKAKDLDLLKEASLVAGDQNACINKVQILGADLSSSLNAGTPSPAVVQSDANQVSIVCEQAQRATNALEGTVNGQS